MVRCMTDAQTAQNTYYGSVLGHDELPFSRAGLGTLSVVGRQAGGSGGRCGNITHAEMCGSWWNDALCKAVTLKEVGTATVFLREATECRMCYCVHASSKKHKCESAGAAAEGVWTGPRKRRGSPGKLATNLKDGGQVSRTDVEVCPVVTILGKEGSRVYAAVRSNLNHQSLLSAGRSSALCLVEDCLLDVKKGKCYNERCRDTQYASLVPSCDHLKALRKQVAALTSAPSTTSTMAPTAVAPATPTTTDAALMPASGLCMSGFMAITRSSAKSPLRLCKNPHCALGAAAVSKTHMELPLELPPFLHKLADVYCPLDPSLAPSASRECAQNGEPAATPAPVASPTSLGDEEVIFNGRVL